MNPPHHAQPAAPGALRPPATARRSDDGIVIAGGGLAAQRCAETLRREGCDEPLRMICAEPRPPYDRPPLSKRALHDPDVDGALAFRPESWYAEHDVDLLVGQRAAGLDLACRRVTLVDGPALRYSRLLIATGGRARRLPLLSGFENVTVLRDLEDARQLREVLASGARLAIVGAGFVGLEVASAARSLGAEVAVLEAAAVPLGGIVGSRMGEWFAALHRAHGVELRTGVTVTSVAGRGRIGELRLSDGSIVSTDHVLVCVGTDPDTGWAAAAFGPGGVPADPEGRTVVGGVFAAGDAAATYVPDRGAHLPGAHWEAAARQASSAARLMLRLPPPPRTVTSFWTDQHGIRAQYLGHARAGDRLVIDPAPGPAPGPEHAEGDAFAAVYIRAGRTVAALLVNCPQRLPEFRQAVTKGVPWPISSRSTRRSVSPTPTVSRRRPASSPSMTSHG